MLHAYDSVTAACRFSEGICYSFSLPVAMAALAADLAVAVPADQKGSLT